MCVSVCVCACVCESYSSQITVHRSQTQFNGYSRSIPNEWKVKVRWVVDGDTFITAGNQFVRLKGIDSPEIAHKRGERDQYYAKEAQKKAYSTNKKNVT